MSVGILSTASYLPDKVLDNKYFESYLDTSDQWIRTRSGIIERRKLESDKSNSDIAYIVAKSAIEKASLRKEDIDVLIVGTVTGDYIFPATACIVAHKLGLKEIPAFDISAACSGFMYSLHVGYSFVKSGMFNKVLIIGSELVTRITDYNDRSTCVLFGDGAGAVIIGETDKSKIIYSKIFSDGSGAEMLYIPAGGTKLSASYDTVDKRLHYVKMNGRELFKIATLKMVEVINNTFKELNIGPNDISLLIPHQMNVRIMEAVCERINFPMSKVFVNIDRYGNTGAASIPIALDEALKTGRIRQKDIVCLVSFGGGLTWAISLIQF
ncbi:MAG: 3-oxoacyl-ACP synthase III family protein [Planctomycetota bacterium]